LPSQLNLLKDFQFDVFFHFWDVIDDAEKEEIVALLKPRAYFFEKPKDFSAMDHDPAIVPDHITPPSRIFSQFYSWHQVGQLVEPLKHDYSIGMRSRSDLQFVFNINHIIPKLKADDILIPCWNVDEFLSDLFALGGIETILYYHRIYEHAKDYAVTKIFNAENILTKHFQLCPDYHLYLENFKYFFVRRPHMENYTNEQAMLENPGQNKWLDPEIVAAHTNFHTMKNGEGGVAYVEQFKRVQLTALVADVREKLGSKKT
jgi:hypothetical protein